jgi:uncharacterized protein (DUF58 family)
MTENNLENLLKPATLAAIKDLEILAKTVINGYFTGLHRSTFKGTGIEFVQYRNYTQGDDFKYVDWKTTGKTDKFYIKVFEEETNMDCQLIIDYSGSMNYDNVDSNQKFSAISKIKYAQMAAACLAYLAFKQGDRLGVTLFSDKIESYLSPSKRKEHLNHVFSVLENTKAQGLGINENITRFIGENLNNRGVVFFISDCLSSEDKILNLLSSLKFKNYDCVLIHLLHYDEVYFPFQNAHMFIDTESNTSITTNPETIKDEYQKEVNSFTEKIKNECLAKEIQYLQVTTNNSLEKILLQFLSTSRKVFR